MRENRTEILQGRATTKEKASVIKYAEQNDLTVSQAVTELAMMALNMMKIQGDMQS